MSRPELLARLAQAQAERSQAGLLRRLHRVDEADGVHIVVNGRRLLSFASTRLRADDWRKFSQRRMAVERTRGTLSVSAFRVVSLSS